MRKLIFGAVALAAMVAAGPAGADVKAGVDAWSRGDYKTAVEQWRPAAIAGDADAQFNLGQAYKLGRGVPLDPALAESWFRKAAIQGHLQAGDNYGLALFQANKKTEAVSWLEKSVARGEPRAQLVLGTMLFNGDGVTRDYPRAYALMTRATASGLQSASQTLAQMDQYISPADRERGTALAAQYAGQEKTERDRLASTAPRPTAPLPIYVPAAQGAGVARADVPPSRVAERPEPIERAEPIDQPRRLPPSHGPERVAAPTRAPARGGGWRIQLGAFRDQGNAEALWGRVRGRLGGAQPYYVKAGGVTRLQAGGFGSKADASRACAASGSSCVVVAP